MVSSKKYSLKLGDDPHRLPALAAGKSIFNRPHRPSPSLIFLYKAIRKNLTNKIELNHRLQIENRHSKVTEHC